MPDRFRNAVLAIAMPIAVVAVATSALLAAGRIQSALHIKPGLWEFDSTGKVSGDTVFRDALLAGVAPGERARRLALLRQGISEPSKERMCVSQAFFDRAIFAPQTGCTQTVLANSSNKIELVSECRAEDHGWKDLTSNRTLVTPTTSAVFEHGVSTQAGKTMTRDTVQRGRWISSDCGSLQPFRAK